MWEEAVLSALEFVEAESLSEVLNRLLLHNTGYLTILVHGRNAYVFMATRLETQNTIVDRHKGILFRNLESILSALSSISSQARCTEFLKLIA